MRHPAHPLDPLGVHHARDRRDGAQRTPRSEPGRSAWLWCRRLARGSAHQSAQPETTECSAQLRHHCGGVALARRQQRPAGMGSPSGRRKALGAVLCLCLLAVFVSHTGRVERWLHHRERWWSTSLSTVGTVDAQRIAFAEAFYESLAERHALLGQDGTAPVTAQPPGGKLAQLRDELAREQKSLDDYLLGEQGLSPSAEHAAEDATTASAEASTEAQAAAEERNACAAEQVRSPKLTVTFSQSSYIY